MLMVTLDSFRTFYLCDKRIFSPSNAREERQSNELELFIESAEPKCVSFLKIDCSTKYRLL